MGQGAGREQLRDPFIAEGGWYWPDTIHTPERELAPKFRLARPVQAGGKMWGARSTARVTAWRDYLGNISRRFIRG
jgi:hypothetical protein